MILYDQHIHSWHSSDCRADPEDNCRAAIEKGLGGVTFTEHFDCHPNEWDTCTFDYAAIRDTVDRLREAYGDRLFVGLGVEICYQPAHMDFIRDYLARHAFDMVVLSVHYFGGRALHEREQWGEFGSAEVTRTFFETTLEAARFCEQLERRGEKPFDILGHLDLVKRYTQRYFSNYDVASHADLIDEILRTCLAADLIPEINTSTWRQGLPEPMPADWVVRRFAELGGTAMTLGSDAHRAVDIGAGLPEAAALLQDAGFEHVPVFRERRVEPIPVSPPQGNTVG